MHSEKYDNPVFVDKRDDSLTSGEALHQKATCQILHIKFQFVKGRNVLLTKRNAYEMYVWHCQSSLVYISLMLNILKDTHTHTEAQQNT